MESAVQQLFPTGIRIWLLASEASGVPGDAVMCSAGNGYSALCWRTVRDEFPVTWGRRHSFGNED